MFARVKFHPSKLARTPSRRFPLALERRAPIEGVEFQSVVRPPPSSRRDKSSGLIERERLVMVFQGESLLSSRTLKRWYATGNLLLSSMSRPVIPSSAEGV